MALRRAIVLFLCLLAASASASGIMGQLLRLRAPVAATPSEYVPVPMPVLWWKCTSTNSDGSVPDSSGNGYTGYSGLIGVNPTASNIFLNAAGYMEVVCPASGPVNAGFSSPTNMPLLNNATNWAMSMWVYSEFGNQPPGMTVDDADQTGMRDASTEWRFLHNAVEGNTAGMRVPFAAAVSNWLWLAISYNNATLTRYSNLVANVDATGFSGGIESNLYWGMRFSTTERHRFADVRIYDRALTGLEATNAYYSVTNVTGAITP
jgi:hypothetical protein